MDKEYHRRYREQHKEERKERRREHRQRTIAWANEIKAHTACADCGGFFHPVCMDWDHLPGTKKSGDVANLVKGGLPRRAKIEMEKCELVCANCHRLRTLARKQVGAEIDPASSPES